MRLGEGGGMMGGEQIDICIRIDIGIGTSFPRELTARIYG